MSKPLRVVADKLHADLVSSRYDRVFEDAKLRHRALEPYPSLGAMVKMFADQHIGSYAERDELTRVLVIEHRARSSRLWSSALVVIYYPMLSRLRDRIVGDTVPDEEKDAFVLEAFLTVIAELPFSRMPNRVAMRLRQATERRVFQRLGRAREPGHLTDDVDGLEDTVLEPRGVAVLRDMQRLDVACVLRRIGKQVLSPGVFDIVVATVIHREELWTLVERDVAECPADPSRVYQRIKRQRSRGLKELRQLFEDKAFGRAARI